MHNHYVLCNNHYVLCHNHYVLCHNHYVLCHNHYVICHNHYVLCRNHYVLCHNHESSSRQIEKKVLRVWIKWKAHKDVRLAKNNKRWIVCQALDQNIYAASTKLYTEKGAKIPQTSLVCPIVNFTSAPLYCFPPLHWFMNHPNVNQRCR